MSSLTALPPRSPGALRYVRHFTLLACIAIALAATDRWRPWHGMVESSGIYGTLHSSTLVLSLRASQSLRRKMLFVAIAACLSMASVTVSLYASRFIGILPAAWGPFLLLCLCSGAGAMSYAVLVRRMWMADLPVRAPVWITLGCVSATLMVLLAETVLQSIGALEFAVSWWFAFSGGLWFHDAT